MAIIPTKKAGDAIYIRVYVRDGTVDPPQLANPSTGPVINIFRPDGSEAVTNGAMTNLSIGIYYYIFQTLTTDQTGQWLVQFQATDNASHTSLSLQYGFFNLT